MNSSILAFKVWTVPLVKTNPIFSLINPYKDSNSGIGAYPSAVSLKNSKSSSSVSNFFILKAIAFLITVFFPITRIPPSDLMAFLIYWHWRDPTFSRVTATIFSYLPSNS